MTTPEQPNTQEIDAEAENTALKATLGEELSAIGTIVAALVDLPLDSTSRVLETVYRLLDIDPGEEAREESAAWKKNIARSLLAALDLLARQGNSFALDYLPIAASVAQLLLAQSESNIDPQTVALLERIQATAVEVEQKRKARADAIEAAAAVAPFVYRAGRPRLSRAELRTELRACGFTEEQIDEFAVGMASPLHPQAVQETADAYAEPPQPPAAE